MVRKKTEKPEKDSSQITRRSAILGGLGISSFSMLSNSRWNLTREVVVAENEEGPVEVERWPVELVEHEKLVDQVQIKLQEKFDDDKRVKGVSIIKSGIEIQGRKATQPQVEIKQGVDKEEIAISEMDGIPVSKSTEVNSTPQSNYCWQDSQYDPIPGGVVFGEYNADEKGTICAKIQSSGDTKMLHVSHAFYQTLGEYCTNIVGESADQAGGYVGSVTDFGKYWDWAIVEIEAQTGTYAQPGIRTNYDNSSHRIAAWFTRSGLKGIIDERQIHKQGVSTGYETGYLKKIDDPWDGPNCIYVDNGVTYDILSAPGDSGAPVWAWGNNNPDNCVMVGMHQHGSAGTAYDDYCHSHNATEGGGGIPAYILHDEKGITFDTSSV